MTSQVARDVKPQVAYFKIQVYHKWSIRILKITLNTLIFLTVWKEIVTLLTAQVLNMSSVDNSDKINLQKNLYLTFCTISCPTNANGFTNLMYQAMKFSL